MNQLKLGLKGFIIGIAFIVPGLSGGTLAVYLGVYEKLLHTISHIFDELKKSLTFLIPLFLGIGISVVSLANLLGYLLNINSLIVMLFFMGIIIGGIKDIYKRATNENKAITLSSVIAFFTSFSLIIILIIGKMGNANGLAYLDINIFSIIILFLIGMAASTTMIVPGVSGSALLIVLGYYTAIVTNVFGNIFDTSQLGYNLQVIIPFGFGAAVGVILFSRFIEKALKAYAKETYFAILGFIVGSVFAIIFEIKDPSTGSTHDVQTPIYLNLLSFLSDNSVSFIVGVLLFIGGFYISKRLTNLNHDSHHAEE